NHLGERSLWAGYSFVFGVLVLCGFGLPLPEDVVLITGGVLAWLSSPAESATLSSMLYDPVLLSMMGVGLLGILAGDSVIYTLGRRFGVHITEHRLLSRLVSSDKISQVEKLMRRRGQIVV